MMFAEKIGRSMKVYVDDMLVKSEQANDHVTNLKESFDVLRKYNEVEYKEVCLLKQHLINFWVYVNKCVIEAKFEKIKTILEISSLRSIKDVQCLTRRIAAINRFVSQATDKSLPFFKALQGEKQFKWIKKYTHAFQQLKVYLSTPLLFSKALLGEHFIFYLVISIIVVSFVLLRV